MRLLLIWIWAIGTLRAQVPGAVLPPAVDANGPANLDFEMGLEGGRPPEWGLSQNSRLEGYSAVVRRTGCHGGAGCAAIVAGPKVESGSAGTLMQAFGAVSYREKVMRLRAWLRLENGRRGDQVRVVFTVEGEKKSAEFVQKGRVTGAVWTLAEVKGKVPKDANEIQIAVTMSGQGTAWIDDVAFEPAIE